MTAQAWFPTNMARTTSKKGKGMTAGAGCPQLASSACLGRIDLASICLFLSSLA